MDAGAKPQWGFPGTRDGPVSELVSLTWNQVIRRDSGEAQLSIIGKGDKTREVLIPAAVAGSLLASRGDRPSLAPVFGSVRRPGRPLTERAINYIVKAAAERAGGASHRRRQLCEM
jgi:integrase/recombinase XerD